MVPNDGKQQTNSMLYFGYGAKSFYIITLAKPVLFEVFGLLI